MKVKYILVLPINLARWISIFLKGIQWLQAEQEVLGKMLGKSALNQTAKPTQNRPKASGSYQGSQTNDATKKKLGLFLGKK